MIVNDPSHRKARGSITVFMIMIMASVFLMIGLTIDMSRILLARYTVENANAAATRSLMAGYNKVLASDYGLFALQKPDESGKDKERSDIATFRKYLNSNLLISNDASYDYSKRSYFSILKLKPDSVGKISIEYSDPIWDDEILKGQINDYEKYRKYISILYEVGDILKDSFSSKTIKSMSEADQAKKMIDSANDNVSEFNKSGSKLMKWIEDQDFWENLTTFDADNFQEEYEKFIKDKINITNAIDRATNQGDTLEKLGKSAISSIFKEVNKKIAGKAEELDYSDFDKLLNEARARMNNLRASIDAASAQVKVADDSLNDDTDSTIDPDKYIKNAGATDFEETIRRINEAEASLDEAERKLTGLIEKHRENTEVYNHLMIIENDVAFVKSRINAIPAPGAGDSGSLDDSQDASGVLTEVPENWLDYIRDEIYTVAGMLNYSALSERLRALSVTSDSIVDGTLTHELGDIINEIVADQNKICNQIEGIEITEAGKLSIPEESDDYEEKEEKDNNEESVKASLDSLRNDLQRLDSNDLGELFSGAYSDRRFSEPVSGWTAASNIFASIPVLNVVSMLTDIVEMFTDDDSFLDSVVLTAYTMDKTNSLLTSTRRNHYFRYGETEYVKYGWDKQWQNVTSSVTDVISLRFTINFAYYFIKTPGSALVRLATAAVLGGIQTAADAINIFVTNSGCTLLPNQKGPKFQYTDYLIVKVFCESNKKIKLLDTIQATLLKRDQSKKADLKKMYTTVTANVEVKVDLIFLRLFGFELIDLGNFNNGFYTVRSSVEMNY